jgi:hypothetical protein
MTVRGCVWTGSCSQPMLCLMRQRTATCGAHDTNTPVPTATSLSPSFSQSVQQGPGLQEALWLNAKPGELTPAQRADHGLPHTASTHGPPKQTIFLTCCACAVQSWHPWLCDNQPRGRCHIPHSVHLVSRQLGRGWHAFDCCRGNFDLLGCTLCPAATACNVSLHCKGVGLWAPHQAIRNLLVSCVCVFAAWKGTAEATALNALRGRGHQARWTPAHPATRERFLCLGRTILLTAHNVRW